MAQMTALTNIIDLVKTLTEKTEALEFRLDQMNEKLDTVAKQQAHINKNTPNLKKMKKQKRAGEPKKNISAFFWFCKEKRPEIKQTNPDASTPEITKLMSIQWHALKSKKKFDALAVTDKTRYIEEMAAFETLQSEKVVS